MAYYLQQFCWPNVNFVPEVELYGRVNEFAKISLLGKGVSFKENGWFLTDTFFNSISVGVWKKYAVIKDLSLLLEGSGRFIVQFGLHKLGCAHKWLDEIEINLEGSVIIPLSFWSDLEDGMLYCKIIASSEGMIYNGAYITNTPPLQDVKLGIVITHFNRKSYVVPAIKRIQEQLILDPKYKDKINLIVIDNSQNITQEESYGAIIIPNENLGGSGGFTRGLLYLKDNGYTHCLFMDDDASCEIESIRRTYALLSFSNIDSLAIAGSLLRETEPYRLFEKGAKFDGFCRPLKSGLDMRMVIDLLLAEKEDVKPDYGGWWFFAFKTDYPQNFPFPFFVRGDDSQFSLLNRFKICTMNGISCWGDDFAMKNSPLTSYLDARYHILHTMIILKSHFSYTLFIVTKLFIRNLFSYNYASAQSVTLALKHVMQGTEFWIRNLDMSEIRNMISSLKPSEKMEKIDLSNFEIVRVDYSESRLRKFIRILTLNGFLLPSFLIKDKTVYQDKSFKAWFRALFRYKRVLYYYEPYQVGYIAYHNKILFFKEIFAFSVQSFKFILKYNKLKNEYLKAIPYMTSENFWREIYKLNGGKT
ncbi:MAG: glycosyltransferase [Candidatus Micrarchaeia archaeon]